MVAVGNKVVVVGFCRLSIHKVGSTGGEDSTELGNQLTINLGGTEGGLQGCPVAVGACVDVAEVGSQTDKE